MDENSRLSRLAVAGLTLSGMAALMTGILAAVAEHRAGGGFGEVVALGAFRAMLEMAIVGVCATSLGLAGASLWRYGTGKYTRNSRVVAALAMFLALAVLVGLLIGR